MSPILEFIVKIPYFDSGTKKEHTIDFRVAAEDEKSAVLAAKKEFNDYEQSVTASWVRIMREDRITVEEKSEQ